MRALLVVSNPFDELRREGVSRLNAVIASGSPTGVWRMSGPPAVQRTSCNEFSLRPRILAAPRSGPQFNRAEAPWCGHACPVVWERRRRQAFPGRVQSVPPACPTRPLRSDDRPKASSDSLDFGSRFSLEARQIRRRSHGHFGRCLAISGTWLSVLARRTSAAP